MKAGIFIGSSIYSESVDIPDVTDLIVLSGMKKYRQVVQRIGRALRPKPGENIVRIFDFFDKMHNVLWKHSNQRVAVYLHDDYRYEVNATLDRVNEFLVQPLVLTVDPLKGLRK
jgi:superfamily II DNA or RNA helicase